MVRYGNEKKNINIRCNKASTSALSKNYLFHEVLLVSIHNKSSYVLLLITGREDRVASTLGRFGTRNLFRLH